MSYIRVKMGGANTAKQALDDRPPPLSALTASGAAARPFRAAPSAKLCVQHDNVFGSRLQGAGSGGTSLVSVGMSPPHG